MKSFVNEGRAFGRLVGEDSGPLADRPTKIRDVPTRSNAIWAECSVPPPLVPPSTMTPSRVGAKIWRLPPRSFPRHLLPNLCPGTRSVAVRVRSVRTAGRRDLSLPGIAETGRGFDRIAGGDPGLRDVFRVVVWRGAAQQYIYRSPGFAILLAFLGMNILCAALIRYPWKKRQTGFVVTHAGLLTLLLGSYYSVRTADEGQVGMLEGDVQERAGPYRSIP